MQVQEIMSKEPACCAPSTSLQEVAQMMVDYDCGALPVVDDLEAQGPLVGVITDRDIVCRAIANNRNPLELTVSDCMSEPVVVIRPEDSVQECRRIMEENQVRRIPVVDSQGTVLGMATQAQVARVSTEEEAGEFLKAMSESGDAPSRVSASR